MDELEAGVWRRGAKVEGGRGEVNLRPIEGLNHFDSRSTDILVGIMQFHLSKSGGYPKVDFL